jgi:hypothetical protein
MTRHRPLVDLIRLKLDLRVACCIDLARTGGGGGGVAPEGRLLSGPGLHLRSACNNNNNDKSEQAKALMSFMSHAHHTQQPGMM